MQRKLLWDGNRKTQVEDSGHIPIVVQEHQAISAIKIEQANAVHYLEELGAENIGILAADAVQGGMHGKGTIRGPSL